MEAITTNTTANATVASHMTALGKAALSLDAGSIFVLAATLSVFVLPLFIIFPPFPPRKSDALNETHNKLGLDPAKSNLLPHKADHNAANTTEPTAKIKSLFVYPVKSCKGIELARAKVVSTGLDFDRLFTFAQLKSPFPISTTTEAPTANKQQQQQQPYWEFITQRQFPLLATVQVELWEPSLTKIAGFRDLAAGASHEVFLLLRFPDPSASAWAHFAAMCTRGSARARAEIEILLPVAVPDADECERKGYVREPVRVWGSNPPALNLGSEIPGALARYLGVSNKLALFRVDPEALREAGANAPPREEVGYQPVVGFADSYPVHVMNLASVRDLEEKVAKDRDLVELTPRRFRANIFVSGSSAYDEDDWKKIKFLPPPGEKSKKSGEATFHVSCRTTRCKLPNVNPDTGVRHSVEPDKTLRAQRAIDKGAPKKGCLGMQMTPLFEHNGSQEFYLEVGMSTEILERGEHMVL